MSSNTTMLKEILQQLSVISIKVDKIDKIESDTEIIKKDINTLKKDVESLKQYRVEIHPTGWGAGQPAGFPAKIL